MPGRSRGSQFVQLDDLIAYVFAIGEHGALGVEDCSVALGELAWRTIVPSDHPQLATLPR